MIEIKQIKTPDMPNQKIIKKALKIYSKKYNKKEIEELADVVNKNADILIFIYKLIEKEKEILNINADILENLKKDIKELKEAAKPKNFEVEENTGAAVQEEIKKDIDPDIKNLFDALNKIKNICKGQERCDNCIFYKKSIDCCLFEEDGCLFKTPERWEI